MATLKKVGRAETQTGREKIVAAEVGSELWSWKWVRDRLTHRRACGGKKSPWPGKQKVLNFRSS